LIHNPNGQSKAEPACTSCILSIFQFHDVTIRYEGLPEEQSNNKESKLKYFFTKLTKDHHNSSPLPLVEGPIEALHELLDVAGQN